MVVITNTQPLSNHCIIDVDLCYLCCFEEIQMYYLFQISVQQVLLEVQAKHRFIKSNRSLQIFIFLKKKKDIKVSSGGTNFITEAVNGRSGPSHYRVTCYHSCQWEIYAEPQRVQRLGKWSQFSKVIKISWRLLRRCLCMSCHRQGQRLSLVTLNTGISTSTYQD